MTAQKKAQTPARKPLAEYKDAQVTPLIQEYADWLTANTGVKVDPLSVFLSSALRSRFQAERREAKAAKPVKKAPAKAPAKKPAAKPAPAKTVRRPSRAATVATPAGVVIAEQRHVDAAKEA